MGQSLPRRGWSWLWSPTWSRTGLTPNRRQTGFCTVAHFTDRLPRRSHKRSLVLQGTRNLFSPIGSAGTSSSTSRLSRTCYEWSSVTSIGCRTRPGWNCRQAASSPGPPRAPHPAPNVPAIEAHLQRMPTAPYGRRILGSGSKRSSSVSRSRAASLSASNWNQPRCPSIKVRALWQRKQRHSRQAAARRPRCEARSAG